MEYVKGLGLPYMGSKRKLAPRIIDFIMKENPECEYIYDLFGGGGAISFEALQRGLRVHYNEFNTGVVELLKDIRDYGVTDKYYKWVDRETFNKHKNDNCWYGGLCKVVWSFGNNQRSYLFGKHVEDDKRLLHEIVVNSCNLSRKEFNKKYGFCIVPKRLLSSDRLTVIKQIKKYKNLQRLEQLERLQQLQQLEISNKSYEDVIINTPLNKTVIYLDPPYENKAKYQNEICYEALLDYIENSKYKVYLSSYESRLPAVWSVEHNSSIAANSNKKVIEKLFISNKYYRKEQRLLHHNNRGANNEQ